MKKITKRILVGTALMIPILLVIAVYLPSILTSKIAASETEAFTSLYSVYLAQMKFWSQNGNERYGTLEELATAGLIDSELATGKKGGYRFELKLTGESFELYATPLIYGCKGFTATGCNSYYINEKRVCTSGDKKGGKASAEDELVWIKKPDA